MLELITDKYYGGIIVEEYGISLENGIPAGAENMLSAGGILLLSAFIVLTIVVIKRWNGRFVNVLAGAFAYSIFVFICCNLIMAPPEYTQESSRCHRGSPCSASRPPHRVPPCGSHHSGSSCGADDPSRVPAFRR